MAESETNSLTMRLLALASYCEGPQALAIQDTIAKLPMAAYKERVAADVEIQRLKQENEDLKQRLAQEVLVNRRNVPPSTPTQPTSHTSRADGMDTRRCLYSHVRSSYGKR